jgi:predicted MPP superfamily phosphohydrolase
VSSLSLLLVAVASAGAGVAVAARHRARPLGWSTVLLGAGGAAAVGGLVGVVLLLRDGLGAVWPLIHLVYLAATTTVPLLALGLGVLAVRRSAPRVLWAVLVVALLPAPLGFYASHVEPFRLRVDHHDVAVDRARAGDDEVRIAVLADLQTPGVGDHERRAVREAMAADPDLILIPGDVFQDPGVSHRRGEAELHDLLSTLEAPHGVYFVRGDADGGATGPAARIFAGTDVVTLVDEVTEVEVGDRALRIGGTALAYDSAAADAVRAGLQDEPDDGAITILLSHRPDTVLDLPDRSRVDLTVAGHTHGGQIVVPGFGPPVTFTDVPRTVARGGLHAVDGNPIYVSPGIGLERGPAPQVRFLSRPAVGVLTLRDA